MRHYILFLMLAGFMLAPSCKKQKIADDIEESGIAGDYQLLVRKANFINSLACDSICLAIEGSLINIKISIKGEIDCYSGDQQIEAIAKWEVSEISVDESSLQHVYLSLKLVWPKKTRTSYQYCFGLSAFQPSSNHFTTHHLQPILKNDEDQFIFLDNKLLENASSVCYYFLKIS